MLVSSFLEYEKKLHAHHQHQIKRIQIESFLSDWKSNNITNMFLSHENNKFGSRKWEEELGSRKWGKEVGSGECELGNEKSEVRSAK